MIRIKLPFQFKIYLIIFFLFILLFYLTTYYGNSILTKQISASHVQQFESLRVLFYSMLRLKIRSIETEAALLADQINVRRLLDDDQPQQSLPPESFSISSLPSSGPRDLLLIMDRHNKILTGQVRFTGKTQPELIQDPAELAQLIQPDSIMKDVKMGTRSARYLRIRRENKEFFFAIVSVPVAASLSSSQILGAVTLGIPVNTQLFQDLRAGSPFHIAFIFGDQVVATSFDARRNLDFRQAWYLIPSKDRMNLLSEPGMITLFENERYLAFASPLPLADQGQGFYVILSSLEKTFRLVDMLKRSVFWMSFFILGLLMLLAYYLSRAIAYPIHYLGDAVSRMIQGDYAVEATIKTGDELERLGERITVMARTLATREKEIQDYVARIENWNKELETSVQERTKDLEDKNSRLRTLSQELTEAYHRLDVELKTVGEMQINLLPPFQFAFQGLCICSLYSPCGRAGGDYYDVIVTSQNQVFVLIADVSGHGIPAAFIMGMTRSMAHTLIEKGSSPCEVLGSLSNILLKTIRRGEFVTMFLARIDLENQALTYSAAGHPAPLFLPATEEGMVELHVERGLPLGIMENPAYEEIQIAFPAGSRLFLYTDGIVEAFNEQKEAFGVERLKELVYSGVHSQPETLLDRIKDELSRFTDPIAPTLPTFDDITLMILDFHPQDGHGTRS
ncbi:MAG: SpoIIE family protein phosphatase [bacterium]|jgi:serine phosphatase RsbU (regulator of sigma subunit)|nr:SpoIIE family protein phosphatase [bacterium]